MIKEVFLTNENYVRNLTNLDNNIQSKFLLSAIREAQEIGFQDIVGGVMFKKLKDLVGTGNINLPSNKAYKDLVDEAQLYLAYQSIVNLCLISSVKISNGGLQQTSDENLTVLDINDTFIVEGQYEKKADFFAERLQRYILRNIKDLPEITETKCNEMKSNLYSAASTNLFLGGYRGRVRKNKCLGYLYK